MEGVAMYSRAEEEDRGRTHVVSSTDFPEDSRIVMVELRSLKLEFCNSRQYKSQRKY